MTYNVFTGTLNPTHSLLVSLRQPRSLCLWLAASTPVTSFSSVDLPLSSSVTPSFRAGNGSLRVTHDPSDPLRSWPMTHGSPGPLSHTSASLTQIYRLPGTVFGLDIVYVCTPLICYIIARVSKLHTQAPVNLEFAKWKWKHCIR